MKLQEQNKRISELKELLMFSLSEILYEYNYQTDQVYWEGAYEEILGYPVEEMAEYVKFWRDMVHPHDITEALVEYNNAKKAHKPFELEYRFKRKDGKYIWIQDRGIVYYNEANEPERVVGIKRDVHKAKVHELKSARLQKENQLFFKESNDLLAVIDFNGMLRRFNPAWSLLLGYTVDELNSKPFFDFLAEEDREASIAAYAEAAEGNVPESFENRYQKKNGDLVWISWKARLDKENECFYVEGREVTKLKKNEQTLQYRAEFEELVASISTGFINISVDEIDEEIEKSIERAGKLVGADSILIGLLKDRTNPNLPIELEYSWFRSEDIPLYGVKRASFNLKNMPFIYTNLKRYGHTFILNSEEAFGDKYPEERALYEGKKVVADMAVLLSYESQILGYMDFTCYKQTPEWTPEMIPLIKILGQVISNAIVRRNRERELEERALALKQSNDELERFAYVASHDLKEPLRMVSSYVQLLGKKFEDNLDEDTKDYIGYATDGVNRMQSLINDLLTYSRVNTRAIPFAETNMNEVIRHVKTNLSATIDETEATIEVEELPTLMADTSQMVQLFQNLISNGIKFCKDSKPHIKVWFEEQLNHYKFFVQDNGIGIDKNYADRIFVLFQRLHNRGQFEGTGIGLAICKRIVERHGGKIDFESEIGQGTTFAFTIKK